MNTQQINSFINSSYPVSIVLFTVLLSSGIILLIPDETVPQDDIEFIISLGWIFVIGSLLMGITNVLGFILSRKNRTNGD